MKTAKRLNNIKEYYFSRKLREVGEMISVDIKDSSLLEKEVEKLLNSNIEVRKKIIKNQFNSIKKHHWDIVVKRLEKILKT